MCSSWSRTQRNTPRREAGASLTLLVESRATRRCTRPAFPATCLRKIVTTSSLVTHVNGLRLRTGDPHKIDSGGTRHHARLRLSYPMVSLSSKVVRKCTPRGHPCEGVPCCPGLVCKFSGGLTRAGYACEP